MVGSPSKTTDDVDQKVELCVFQFNKDSNSQICHRRADNQDFVLNYIQEDLIDNDLVGVIGCANHLNKNDIYVHPSFMFFKPQTRDIIL